MPQVFHTHLLILIVLSILGSPRISQCENYALVVGVNNCPAYQQNGVKPRPLLGAELDADRIADLLKNRFSFSPKHVTVLKGANATRTAIHTEFKKLAQIVKANDQVVFHFSGHGTQCVDRCPLDEKLGDGLDEALCSFDTKANGENLILDDDLARWLDDLPCRSTTVILDCCHSGTGIKDPKPGWRGRFLPLNNAHPLPNPDQKDSSWSDLDPGAKDPHRRIIAIYACQSDQRAYEGPHPKYRCEMGLFTGYLLEGFSRNLPADADGNRDVSVKEIVDYATKQIDEFYNVGLDPKDRQTPSMEASRETWPFIQQRGAR